MMDLSLFIEVLPMVVFVTVVAGVITGFCRVLKKDISIKTLSLRGIFHVFWDNTVLILGLPVLFVGLILTEAYPDFGFWIFRPFLTIFMVGLYVILLGLWGSLKDIVTVQLRQKRITSWLGD